MMESDFELTPCAFLGFFDMVTKCNRRPKLEQRLPKRSFWTRLVSPIRTLSICSAQIGQRRLKMVKPHKKVSLICRALCAYLAVSVLMLVEEVTEGKAAGKLRKRWMKSQSRRERVVLRKEGVCGEAGKGRLLSDHSVSPPSSQAGEG